MYKTAYICDCCGAEMTLPMYTLELKTNSLCIQDQVTWHYCGDCWGYIKKGLTKKDKLNDLEETVKELKEENKKLKKDTTWYEQFFMSIYTAFMNNLFCEPTGYGFTTINTTNEEKVAQKKPFISNGPFSVGCCCENLDSLDYKQSIGMI